MDLLTVAGSAVHSRCHEDDDVKLSQHASTSCGEQQPQKSTPADASMYDNGEAASSNSLEATEETTTKTTSSDRSASSSSCCTGAELKEVLQQSVTVSVCPLNDLPHNSSGTGSPSSSQPTSPTTTHSRRKLLGSSSLDVSEENSKNNTMCSINNNNNNTSLTAALDEEAKMSWDHLDSMHSRVSCSQQLIEPAAQQQQQLGSNSNNNDDSFLNDSCGSFASFGGSSCGGSEEDEETAAAVQSFQRLEPEPPQPIAAAVPRTALLLKQQSYRLQRGASFRGSLSLIQEKAGLD